MGPPSHEHTSSRRIPSLPEDVGTVRPSSSRIRRSVRRRRLSEKEVTRTRSTAPSSWSSAGRAATDASSLTSTLNFSSGSSVSRSAKRGMRPAPATRSALICAQVRAETFPLPPVTRSRVSSWKDRTTPSAVVLTSVSIHS